MPEISHEIGRRFQFLADVQTEAAALRKSADDYTATNRNELRTICRFLLDRGESKIGERFSKAYSDYVVTRLQELEAAPRPIKLDLLRQALALQTNVQADLTDPAAIRRIPGPQLPKLRLLPDQAVKTAELLTSRYAQDTRAELTANLGFPVFRNPSAPKTLSEDELAKLNQTVAGLDSDLGDVVRSHPKNDELNALLAKVKQCKRILTVLIDTNNVQRSYKIKVDPSKNDSAGRRLINSYYGLSIAAKGKSPEVRNISKLEGAVFGVFQLADALTVNSTRFPETPEKGFDFNNTIPTWAALRLRATSAEKGVPSSDGPDGYLQVTSNPKDVIRVLLEFTTPLPPDNEWPTSDEWTK
jgi:hypothetical protein